VTNCAILVVVVATVAVTVVVTTSVGVAGSVGVAPTVGLACATEMKVAVGGTRVGVADPHAVAVSMSAAESAPSMEKAFAPRLFGSAGVAEEKFAFMIPPCILFRRCDYRQLFKCLIHRWGIVDQFN
jgi:hypothetical protein